MSPDLQVRPWASWPLKDHRRRQRVGDSPLWHQRATTFSSYETWRIFLGLPVDCGQVCLQRESPSSIVGVNLIGKAVKDGGLCAVRLGQSVRQCPNFDYSATVRRRKVPRLRGVERNRIPTVQNRSHRVISNGPDAQQHPLPSIAKVLNA